MARRTVSSLGSIHRGRVARLGVAFGTVVLLAAVSPVTTASPAAAVNTACDRARFLQFTLCELGNFAKTTEALT